jgi:SRSO17 transposase
MWLPLGQAVRANKWRDFERLFSTGKTEKRYIREIIFGKRREISSWQVTKNKETLPENSTWYMMTKIPKIRYKDVLNNIHWIARNIVSPAFLLGVIDPFTSYL